MRMLALLALIPHAALAGDLLVPSEYADVSTALVAARDGDRILVDGTSYDGEAGLVDHLLVDLSVRIEGVNRRPLLPGILVRSGGHDVELAFLGFQGPSPLDGVLAIVRQTGGSLALTDVELPPAEGAPGIFLSGVTAEIDGLYATGYALERPVEARGGSDLTIRRSTFTDHTFGAVLVSEASALVIEESTFARNRAGRGADVEVLDRSTAVLRDSGFAGSVATNGGGSVYVERSALELDGCTFTDTSAFGPGGALFATLSQAGVDAGDALYPLTIRGSRFERADGVDQGGTLLLNSVAAVIEDTDFVGSAVADSDTGDADRPDGGVIAAGGGSLTVRRASFQGFAAPNGQGGAIAVVSGLDPAMPVVHIEESSFLGDPAVVEARRGGALDLSRADVVLDRVLFTDTAAAEFGGAVYVIESTLLARTVDIARASTDGLGGALRATRSDLDLGDVAVADVSAYDGGVLAFGDGAANSLLVDGLYAERFAADSGAPGLAIEGAVESTIRGSRLCGGSSGDPAAGVVEYRGDFVNGAAFHNNIALGAEVAAIVRRGTPGTVDTAIGTLDVRHNTLLEAHGVEIYQGSAAISDNIFGFASAGVLAGGTAGAITGDYNLWWALDVDASPTSLALPGANAVFAEPGFVAYATGDCTFSGWLLPDASARDAGTPAPDSGEQDDIGATGGPGSILADVDADGIQEDLDCDDTDPAVGGEEVPGNAVDEDCDGVLDDADGDGFSAPEDCDDTDPERHPLASDIPGDGIDQDCTEADAQSRVGGGCACASSEPGGFGLVLALLLALRRRGARHR